MFNDNSDTGDEGVARLLFRRQIVPSGFFLELKCHDPFWLIALKACIFDQRDLGGKREGFVVHDLLVVAFAFIGLAQVLNFAGDNPANDEILDRMGFFLPL